MKADENETYTPQATSIQVKVLNRDFFFDSSSTFAIY